MIFSFENLGIIKSAEIKLDGLTVLTGLNDTGKSFLSKAIFSIVKTNKEASLENRNLKFQLLQQRFRAIQQIEGYAYSGFNQETINQLQPIIVSNVLYNNIIKIWNSTIVDVNINDIVLDLQKYKERIIGAFSKNTIPTVIQNRDQQLKNLDTNINNIIQALKTRIEDPEKDCLDFYNMVIIPQLFKKQINSVINKDSGLTIKATQSTQPDLNITIKNNVCVEFKGAVAETYSDAVYIESPTILQLLPFITNALAFGGNIALASQQRLAGLPYHLYDLINKIANNANSVANIEYQTYINDIRAIIGGKLFYDSPSRTISYSKNENNIQDINIASGIKGFGILDILFSENILNKKTLLIIDEPEVHLHPKWEVKYAEIIVAFSKIGIHVLVSSHSVYFLQSLVEEIKKQEIESITKFYFGSKTDNSTSSFDDVTDELKPIWDALAEPMAGIK